LRVTGGVFILISEKKGKSVLGRMKRSGKKRAQSSK